MPRFSFININMFDTLYAMEAAEDKAALLSSLWKAKEFSFFHGTKLGLDPQIQFGLASAPLIDEEDDFEGDFTFQNFQFLIQNILSRPDQAQSIARSFAESANAKQWNAFYRKILLKKVSWITIDEFNKFLNELATKDSRAKEFMIKQWQLPGTVSGTIKDIKPPVLIEPFVSGQRVNVFLYETGKTEIVDNKGFPVQFNLQLNEQWPFPFVLDGIIQEQTLWVFDLIPMDHFQEGICDIPLVNRTDVLNQMIGLFQEKDPNIKILFKVEHTEVDKAKIAETFSMFKQMGYSKALVKPMQGNYDRTNRSAWRVLKVG